MIGHLRLVSNGQHDFKVCDWPLRLVSEGELQTLKSTRPSWTFEPRPKWPHWPVEPGLNGCRPLETSGHMHGSHRDWKTWKNGKAFTGQGKVREFY